MGADIRTKSSVDEHLMAPGTELPPMDVGQGLEIRVFDNFPAENMKSVYRVIALLAENSRVHHADQYIYDNHGWKASAQEAMKEGWNGILTTEYVHDLERNLLVDLSGLDGRTQAFDVFSEVYTQLVNLRSDGFWTGLLLDYVDLEPVLDNPNRYSWVSAHVGFLYGKHDTRTHFQTFNPCVKYHDSRRLSSHGTSLLSSIILNRYVSWCTAMHGWLWRDQRSACFSLSSTQTNTASAMSSALSPASHS